jgi:hypothetical protein
MAALAERVGDGERSLHRLNDQFAARVTAVEAAAQCLARALPILPVPMMPILVGCDCAAALLTPTTINAPSNKNVASFFNKRIALISDYSSITYY